MHLHHRADQLDVWAHVEAGAEVNQTLHDRLREQNQKEDRKIDNRNANKQKRFARFAVVKLSHSRNNGENGSCIGVFGRCSC
jgi:hypothetical protein